MSVKARVGWPLCGVCSLCGAGICGAEPLNPKTCVSGAHTRAALGSRSVSVISVWSLTHWGEDSSMLLAVQLRFLAQPTGF